MNEYKFRHYKGNIYTLICFGTNTETREKMVVYKDNQGNTWIRPKEMFFEKVVVDGKEQQRFEQISGELDLRETYQDKNSTENKQHISDLEEIWKPVSSVIKHLNMDYDEAITIGSQFGKLMSIIEKKDKEIENLKSQVEKLKTSN